VLFRISGAKAPATCLSILGAAVAASMSALPIVSKRYTHNRSSATVKLLHSILDAASRISAVRDQNIP
jgi:hypothetical protein